MNTTLRYWYPHEQRCRYISFSSITQAIEMIKWYNKIGIKSEVVK